MRLYFCEELLKQNNTPVMSKRIRPAMLNNLSGNLQ
jgi:hypothetical protein